MDIVKLLKEKGYRLTKPRQELLTVLVGYPMSVEDICNTMKKKKVKIDLASIYRSLELFMDMGVVRVVELGRDKKSYELVDENNHHHHLVCNNCKKIEDISLNESNFLKEIVKKSKFKVDHHHLEFFGLCNRCQ